MVEDAMVDDELERLAKLTPAELDAEMNKLDIDEGRARTMVEQAITGADALEAAEKKTAPVPAEAPLARVVSLAQAKAKRNARIMWLAIAAGTVVTVGVTQGQQIVAWISPPPPAPSVPPSVSPVNGLTPQERAAKVREEAFADCEKGYVDVCEDELDVAKELDPVGDDAEPVQHWRETIRERRQGGKDFTKVPSPLRH
jgi:hypothetical protein